MEDSVPKYDLFQKAYKKLKSTAYYDKTNLHLRDRIAEAENTLNITDRGTLEGFAPSVCSVR